MPAELAFTLIDRDLMELPDFPIAQVRLHVGIPVDLDVYTQQVIRDDRAVQEVVTEARRTVSALVLKWHSALTTNLSRLAPKQRKSKLSQLQRQNIKSLEGEIRKVRASSGPRDRRGGIDHRLEGAVLSAVRRNATKVAIFEQTKMKTRATFISSTLMLAINGIAAIYLGKVSSGLAVLNTLLEAATSLYKSYKKEAELRAELTAIFKRIAALEAAPSSGMWGSLTGALSVAIWGTDASQAESKIALYNTQLIALEMETRQLAVKLEELLDEQTRLQLTEPTAPQGSPALQEIVVSVSSNGDAIASGQRFSAYAARQIRAAKARGKYTGQDQVDALREIGLSWKAFTLVCYTVGAASFEVEPWGYLQKTVTKGIQDSLQEAITDGVEEAFEEQLKKVKISMPTSSGGAISLDLSDLKKLVELAMDPPADAMAKGKAAAELLSAAMEKAEEAGVTDLVDSELFTEAYGQIKDLVDNVAEVLDEEGDEDEGEE